MDLRLLQVRMLNFTKTPHMSSLARALHLKWRKLPFPVIRFLGTKRLQRFVFDCLRGLENETLPTIEVLIVRSLKCRIFDRWPR